MLAMPFLRRFISGPAVLMLGVLLVVAAFAIPNELLSV